MPAQSIISTLYKPISNFSAAATIARILIDFFLV